MLTFSPRWVSLLFAAAILLSIVLALALRVPGLERRPMHNDEAVQAAKSGALFESHGYVYDPNEFHGPTLYYFTLPSLWLSAVKSYADSTEFNYRIVPVCFGAAAILLLLLVADGMGRVAVVCSALLTAVSPALVFYSRDYIQETPLVFFTFAAIACGWRYTQSRAGPWALLTGAAIGFMHATKETSVIALFSRGVALVGTRVLGRNEGATRGNMKRNVLHAAFAILAAVGVSILFYSSFFTHARGPLDSILTFVRYFTRSNAANVHDKPWHFYIRLLTWNHEPGAPIWTEVFITVLALIGGVQAFRRNVASEDQARRRTFARFIAIYTAVMILAYSLIAYKTPWCALSFLHGLILLAGVGAASLLKGVRYWGVLAILLLAGTAHLGWQAFLMNGKFMSDLRNPYAYALTSPDAVRLGKRVEDLAALHADGRGMRVTVMEANADYWPLPWYLRKLERVGFWYAPPPELDAPVLIASGDFDNELLLELPGTYQKNQYGLRPGKLLWLYIDSDLWKKYLAAQHPEHSK